MPMPASSAFGNKNPDAEAGSTKANFLPFKPSMLLMPESARTMICERYVLLPWRSEASMTWLWFLSWASTYANGASQPTSICAEPIASMTAVYDVGTETLKFRFVASVRSLASGSPDASTLVESADGTNAIATGLLVEPFWSPVGAGPACGFGSGVACAAAGLGDAAAPGDGEAAGLAEADGDAATAADGDAATAAVVGLAGAVVAAGAVVGDAAGAAGWQAARAGNSRAVAEMTANARATRRCIFVTAPCGRLSEAPAMIQAHPERIWNR